MVLLTIAQLMNKVFPQVGCKWPQLRATTAFVFVSFIFNCKSPPNACQISTCFQIPHLHIHRARVIDVSIRDMGLFFI